MWWRYGDAAVRLLLLDPNPLLAVASVVVSVAAFLLAAARWRGLIALSGEPVSLWPLAWARAAGVTLSSLLPAVKFVGDGLRILCATGQGIAAPVAIATVAIDRILELGASVGFGCFYTATLVHAGVHDARQALASVIAALAVLVVGVWYAVRRLREGRGVISAFAYAAGLDRLPLVHRSLGAVEAAEGVANGIVANHRRLLSLFGLGIAANACHFLEHFVLLRAFGLPSSPFYVIAAIVAAEVARSVPVPAAIGAMEGAEVWLFSLLGYPPDVGLAVGLVFRLREMLWLLPGGVYLIARAFRPAGDDSGAFAAV